MKTTSKRTAKRTSNKPVEDGTLYWKRMHKLEKLGSHLCEKEVPDTIGIGEHPKSIFAEDLNSLGFDVTIRQNRYVAKEHLSIVYTEGTKIYGDEKTRTHSYLIDYSLPVKPGDRIAVTKKDGTGTIGNFKDYVTPEGMRPIIIMDASTFDVDEIESIGKVTGYFMYVPFEQKEVK